MLLVLGTLTLMLVPVQSLATDCDDAATHMFNECATLDMRYIEDVRNQQL